MRQCGKLIHKIVDIDNKTAKNGIFKSDLHLSLSIQKICRANIGIRINQTLTRSISNSELIQSPLVHFKYSILIICVLYSSECDLLHCKYAVMVLFF